MSDESTNLTFETRQQAYLREIENAAADNTLWTLYGALSHHGKSRVAAGRTGFLLLLKGRKDSPQDVDAFTSQHVGAIRTGPTYLVGTKSEVARQAVDMFTLDEVLIRWSGGS